MLRVLQIVIPAVALDSRQGVNGPEVRVARSLSFLDPSGCSMRVAYDPQGRLWAELSKASGGIVPFRFTGKHDLIAIARIAALIRRHRSQVVHTQGPASLDLFAGIASALARVPHVITRPVMIEDLQVSEARRFVYGALDRIPLKLAAAIVAVSDDGYERLSSQLEGDDRVRAIYNGIDTSFFRTRQNDKAADPSAFRPVVVGGVGQLTANKGWDKFLEVIASLRARYSNLQALVVGDGPHRGSLEKLCAALGIQEIVTFAGHVEDVRSALGEIDVFLLMSRREGLSVAVLESMASGIPCVCTNVGGVREQVIHGATGYLVPVDHVVQAVERVGTLLDDPGLRMAMGREGRKLCETKFDIRTMVKRYQQVYQLVADNRAAPTTR